jgi:TusA-related sulfurtransferase
VDEPTHCTLIGAPGDGVAFLDAPGLDAGTLFQTIAEVLTSMAAGGILTVYTDESTAVAASTQWCTGGAAELLAVIQHECNGATLTFRCIDPRP